MPPQPGEPCRAYLDIETTGLDRRRHELTVVGICLEHDGRQELVQLHDGSLTAGRLLAALPPACRLYSYNGARFDLPFIAARLGIDLARAFPHRDLMHDCWRHDLRGGLKAVEVRLGIGRETAGLDGAAAVSLWRDYRLNGNHDALRLLLRYNAEDITNLVLIRRKLGVR